MKTPKLCEAFSELSPVIVVGGEQTMFAITRDGKVCEWCLCVCCTCVWCLCVCVLYVSACVCVNCMIHMENSDRLFFHCLHLVQVYASGYGAYGRLGIGGVEGVSTPTLITSLATRGQYLIFTQVYT